MFVDLEAIRVLIAVVDQGSFSAAAEKLNKTQSAVSYQVSKLEQKLDTQVFDRSSYRATLTPVGERVVQEGRRLLDQADNLGHLVNSFAAGWEPNLELVVDGMLPEEPLLQIMKEVTEQKIPTHLQLRIEFLGGVQKRFAEDKADLMVVLDYRSEPTLASQQLAAFDAVLVCSEQYELAKRKGLELTDLQQGVEITVHDSSYNTAYGGSQTFGGDRLYYLSDFRSKKAAIMMGLGFGWMPFQQVKEELAQGELVELDYIGGSRCRYTPLLVHRLDKPLGKTGLLLQQKLLKYYGANVSEKTS